MAFLFSEENGRFYIDNAEHIQKKLSERAFVSTTKDLEVKLDEADRQAAEMQIRYSADEVFDRVRKNIRAGA